MDNSRRFYRLEVVLPGKFKIGSNGRYTSWGECDILDVSAGGARITTKLSIPVDRENLEMIIKFKLIDLYELVAVPLRDNIRGKDIHSYGIQWKDIDKDTEGRIVRDITKMESKRIKTV